MFVLKIRDNPTRRRCSSLLDDKLSDWLHHAEGNIRWSVVNTNLSLPQWAAANPPAVTISCGDRCSFAELLSGGGGTNATPSVVFGRVGTCRLQGNVVSLPTSGPQNVNLVVTAK